MSGTSAEARRPDNRGRVPWNKGKLVGQKPPLKLKEVWRVRFWLQQTGETRDLALFDLAIDSKLRGCDLVHLKVDDIAVGGRVKPRAVVRQLKTGHPVQFELTEQTREAVAAWIQEGQRRSGDYLFPNRRHSAKPPRKHLSDRPATCEACRLASCAVSIWPCGRRMRSTSPSPSAQAARC